MTGDPATAVTLWVIYDHPVDHPHFFVARRFDGNAATDDFILGNGVAELRDRIKARGFYCCIPRAAADDPKIVETWL